MSLWRHAPAGMAAALAAATLGLLLQRERAHGAEMRALTHEIASLRTDLADRGARTDEAPRPPPVARCGFDSDTIQAIAGAVVSAVGRTGLSLAPPPSRDGTKGAPPGASPVEPVRTTEQEVALASVHDSVQAILSRGKLTPMEMGRLGQQIALAGESPETDAVRAQIAQAINDGKLVYERPHAP